MRVLAGDIGGTHARLAVFSVEEGRYEVEARERWSSADHDSLAGLVAAFREEHGAVDAACIGVPGPVRGDRAELTNLPWVVEAAEAAEAAGVPRAGLINDLEAQAWGIGTLGHEELTVLQEGNALEGNRALLSAGTGLGQAGLYWDGTTHRPFASEGGHASFAPVGDVQVALLRFLADRFGGHVSWERVLSGSGLRNLHDFLAERAGVSDSGCHPEGLDGAHPERITLAATQGSCSVCAEAVALFVALYGSAAGNLALTTMAAGGVYLGGGIAPDLLDELREGFVAAFTAKGRMSSLLEQMPVRVIVHGDAALRGAARYAVLLEES